MQFTIDFVEVRLLVLIDDLVFWNGLGDDGFLLCFLDFRLNRLGIY